MGPYRVLARKIKGRPRNEKKDPLPSHDAQACNQTHFPYSSILGSEKLKLLKERQETLLSLDLGKDLLLQGEEDRSKKYLSLGEGENILWAQDAALEQSSGQLPLGKGQVYKVC